MKGPAFLLAGIVLFSLLDANNKLMSGQFGVGQAAVFRYVTLLSIFLLLRPVNPDLLGPVTTARPGMHLARTASMMVSVGGFYTGFSLLPLAEGYLVFFTAPFMTLALAALVLRERVPRAAWLWCAVGFGGVLLAVLPKLGAAGSALGYAALLIGTIGFSVTQTVNRVLRHEHGLARILFWPAIAGVILYSPLMVLGWATPGPVGLLQLCLGGAFAGAATICTALAYRSADAARLGPYNYVALPVAVLLDLLIWRVAPDPLTIAGGVVVVVACLLSERARRRALTESLAGSGAARPDPGAAA